MTVLANTKFDNIYLDASVLVAIIGEEDVAANITNKIFSEYSQVYASVISIMFAYRHNLRRKNSQGKDNSDLLNLLEGELSVLSMTKSDYSKAKLILKNSDLEDAVQIATCLNAGVQNFLTLDKTLLKLYSDKLNIICFD